MHPELMNHLERAERNAGIQEEDVRSVAQQLNYPELTEEQVIEILECYPEYEEYDPSGMWYQIVEQILSEKIPK